MFSAVLDANVLYPLHYRDLLLYANLMGTALYAPVWSDAILEEMGRNLVGKGQVTEQHLPRLIAGMKRAYPDAVRNPPASLIAAMTNDTGDRHVLATAVLGGAEVIVTQNVRHYPAAALQPHGIEVQTLDEFLSRLLSQDPVAMVAVFRHLLAPYKRPPYDAAQLLTIYGAQAPVFASDLAQRLPATG